MDLGANPEATAPSPTLNGIAALYAECDGTDDRSDGSDSDSDDLLLMFRWTDSDSNALLQHFPQPIPQPVLH
eukprot:gene11134-biopygen3261